MARTKGPPRTPEDLQRQLAEQLDFLQRSADAFDRGLTHEAKRLAVTVRVLVHDTGLSHSVLSQLQMKDRQFYDSAMPLLEGNVAAHSGLVVTVVKKGATRPVAMLDGAPGANRWVAFDPWWTTPVFIDDRGERMSRKDLVLALANTDGGAHVDPELDEWYHRLVSEGSTGILVVDGKEAGPLPEPAGPSMRQIAHEVLKSSLPGYRKTVEHEADFYVGSMAAFDSPFPPPGLYPVGRNHPCPCGSERKYKKCHGKTGR